MSFRWKNLGKQRMPDTYREKPLCAACNDKDDQIYILKELHSKELKSIKDKDDRQMVFTSKDHRDSYYFTRICVVFVLGMVLCLFTFWGSSGYSI